MSFGFAVGDSIAVGELSWRIYRSCKGLTEEFHEISREALTVHTVVKELQDEADNMNSVLNRRGTPRKQELLLLIRNLKSALLEVDIIVQKYQGLARRERRIWNQLKFATEDLGQVRGKLTVHLAAINVFTDSLSRSTLSQIEKVLLELISEVREGRRPPSIVPSDERDENSVWNELELELAEDGISKADVAQHKTAIKVFLQNLLSDVAVEAMSLDEVASLVESSNEHDHTEQVPRCITKDSRVPTMSSTGSEQYESAAEELADEDNSTTVAPMPRVSFAPPIILPNRSKDKPDRVQGIDSRLQYLTRRASAGSIYRYRHSIDASIVDPKATENKHDSTSHSYSPQAPQMILIVDPTHSSVSKLAHALLRSLVITYPIVRAHIDTVRSTAWQEYGTGGTDSLSLDNLIREFLTSREIKVPQWRKQIQFASFRLRDLVEFDHIVYFNSPSFRKVLEEHIETIAALKEAHGTPNKSLARLTGYDLLPSLQIPDFMSEGAMSKEILRNRQRLALEEVFRKVRRFILTFLEQEFGLKKTGQGFEEIPSRRPSRSSPLPLLDHESRSG